MSKELLFSLISTGVYLVGAIPYWRDVLRWRTTPHVFTFGIWVILTAFNIYVLIQHREFYALIPSAIMLFSLFFFGFLFWLKYYKKVKKDWFDWFCLSLAIAIIAYYLLFKNTLNTVIFTTIVDFIAFLPTFKKWWFTPWTESILLYFQAGINQIFTFLALNSPNPETTIFWLYLVVANLLYFFLVFFRRWYLKGWKSIFE